MSDIKFTITKGQQSVMYEGSEEFLLNNFPSVLAQILDSPLWSQTSISPNSQLEEDNSNGAESKSTDPTIPSMTMNSLCSKLGCQSGTDLVLAASVYLTFISKQESLPRKDIIQTMKGATRYFKGTYVSNLTKLLQSLVKQGKLMERSDEVYVLTPSYSDEVESLLAQS